MGIGEVAAASDPPLPEPGLVYCVSFVALGRNQYSQAGATTKSGSQELYNETALFEENAQRSLYNGQRNPECSLLQGLGVPRAIQNRCLKSKLCGRDKPREAHLATGAQRPGGSNCCPSVTPACPGVCTAQWTQVSHPLPNVLLNIAHTAQVGSTFNCLQLSAQGRMLRPTPITWRASRFTGTRTTGG